jgi:integrase
MVGVRRPVDQIAPAKDRAAGQHSCHAALEGDARQHAAYLDANSYQQAWRGKAGECLSQGHACRKAKITGLTFHDLRGTAVTRLAEAGCSHAEIAAITGHSMRDVAAILDKYLARTDKIALAAIAKLERGRA